MSRTLTLTGVGNVLSVNYFPPLELNSNYDYCLALLGFYGTNSIRNLYPGNNKFYYGDKVIIIPSGAYELDEISEYIKSKIDEGAFELEANNNTLHCSIISSYPIDFKKPDNIGRMLGFSPQILESNVRHESDLNVQILKATNIHIESNITVGAYRNSALSHTIFEFDISVEPGFRLVKEPSTPVYLPINVNSIDNLTLKLVDQNGELVDFGIEPVTIRLELKQNGFKSGL